MRIHLLALILLGATLWVGCSAESTTKTCASAAECLPGQLCQAGSCFNACTDDVQCESGEICDQGLCLNGIRCGSNEGCPSGTVCEANYCRSQTPECERSTECPPGLSCIGGACIQGGADAGYECLTPADCGAGERCVDNHCVPESDTGVSDTDGSDTSVSDSGEPDTSEADIAEPDVPQPDANEPDVHEPDIAEPDTGCTFNSDCEGSQICVDGECVGDEDTGVECSPYTSSCSGASECCSNLCVGATGGVGTCTQECARYSDCNPPGVIDDYFCIAAAGAEPDTTVNICARSDFERSCDSSSGCLGQACLRIPSDSACTWQCSTVADCPPTTACTPVTFAGPTVLDVCVPMGARCAVADDCFTGVCLTDDATPGLGYCSAFCAPGANRCPSGFSCTNPDPTQPDLFVCVSP